MFKFLFACYVLSYWAQMLVYLNNKNDKDE